MLRGGKWQSIGAEQITVVVQGDSAANWKLAIA